MTRALPRLLALLVIAGLVVAATAVAATTYTRHSLGNRTAQGSPVEGSSTLRVGSSASVLAPSKWRSQRRSSRSQLRFTSGQTNCRYAITLRIKAVQAAEGTSLNFARGALPAASARYVLDEGVRGRSAWRVIRLRTTGGVQVRGIRVVPVSTGSASVPAGQDVWLRIDATANSTRGSECHSGPYREALGPELGDAFAAARSRAYVAR